MRVISVIKHYMDSPVILLHLIALSRSRTTQTDPAHDFDGRGDRRIRRCDSTNGCAFDLPRSILNVKILGFLAIAMVLSLLDRTILFLKPSENTAIFPFDAPRVVMLTGLSRLAASDFTIGKDLCCIVLEQF